MKTSPDHTGAMSARAIFKAANDLYAGNGKLIIGIATGPILLKAVLDTVLPSNRPVLSGLALLADLFLITLAVGTVVIAISARYRDQPMTIVRAYQTLGLRGALAIFVATLLTFVLIGAGLVLLIIPGLFLLVKFAFVAQVVALEDAGIAESLSRSWRITDGNLRRVISLSLLNVVFQIACAAILLPFILVFLHFTGAVGAFLVSLLTIFSVPFVEGLLTILYLDIVTSRKNPHA